MSQIIESYYPPAVETHDSGSSPPSPPEQFFLFDEVDRGSELLRIDEDRKASRHTGSILERRQELYDAICERLAAGVAIRKVCRIYGVGRNTVRAIVRRLEASGKMEPLKRRLAAKYGEVIELGTDFFLEKLEAGEVPVTAIPVAVGIFADKKALLEGEPTAILGKSDVKQISIDGVNGFWERMKRLKGQVLETAQIAAPGE